MTKMTFEQAWKFTNELMEANIHLWKGICEYYRVKGIELPNDEYTRRIDYYLHQVLDQIEVINDVSPEVKRSHFSPEDDNGTELLCLFKRAPSIFHTGAGKTISDR